MKYQKIILNRPAVKLSEDKIKFINKIFKEMEEVEKSGRTKKW